MTDELSARDELYEIADFYRRLDTDEKEAKKEKEQVRPAFLALVSEVIREEIPLARETVTVPLDEVMRFEHPERWVAATYPGWRLVGLTTDDGQNYTVTIEENEDYKKFEFSVGGFKFGRTVAMKDAGFDVEGFSDFLKTAEISDSLKAKMLDTVSTEIIYKHHFDESAAIALMADKPETTAIFQQFIIPGIPEVRLLPIKVAKEHEE